ncbi:MAG TPA: ParB/RepB/Spo0J family partition protein [Candidatus Dormibacteraeota bacterium]
MSATRARGLGRGLQSLIPLPSEAQTTAQLIAVDQIQPSPEQSRRRFASDTMRELTDSIRAHGVLQPVLVRRVADGYQLIAGERRWRAARQAGLVRIPAVIKQDADEQDSLLLGLIENLQREDLDPIEEAQGIQRMVEQFGLTHEQAAARLGKQRVAVTQSLRLLQGAPAVISATAAGAITAGHARAIVGLANHSDQERALRVVLAKQLSVRQTEKWIRGYRPRVLTGRTDRTGPVTTQIREFELAIEEALRVPVTISGTVRGRITIRFASREQLAEVVQKLTS